MSEKILSGKDEANVIALYGGGLTVKTLAERFECSTGPILHCLRAADVPMRISANYQKTGRRIFSEGEDQEIAAAYESGLSLRSIADSYGRSTVAITTSLQRTKTPRRNGHPSARFTVEQDAVVAREYTEGKSLAVLAKQYECSNVAIRSSLKRSGTAVRPSGPEFHQWTTEQIAGMVELYEERQSQEKIASAYGTSAGTVARILEEAGCEMGHTRGEKSGLWKGGRLTRNGYAYVRIYADHPFASMRLSNGYIAEHRLVMATELGRPLSRAETVHHKNGIHDDNRIENLELRHGKHGKHQAFVCADCGSHNVVSSNLG